MTHMTLQAVRQLIANDSYAITFQSVEQYRAKLLRHFDNLTEGPAATQQVAAPGAQDGWKLVPERATPEMLLAAGYRATAEGLSDTGHRAWARLLAAVPSAPGTPEVPQTAAARDVLAERKRQVEVEGWTPAHDDAYLENELPRAASAYTLGGQYVSPPAIWPWTGFWWKPRNARANYVRAGALLIAEIERLDRAAIRAAQEVGAA